jgi:tagatose 6-phosphate kinase
VGGFAGGHAGNFIVDGLQQEGIRWAFTRTPFESRTCLSIVDRQTGSLTEIYEKGEPIPAEAREALLLHYTQLLPQAELVILSGSLPQGLAPDFYVALIQAARAAGKPVFLDASGEALRLGVEQGKPDMIKPNRSELQAIWQGRLADMQDIVSAARALAQAGGMKVAVSLGADGLVYADGERAWLAAPPQVAALSAVGSGDCLLAGLAIGCVRGWPVEETLRLAVAMGAANTLMLGAGRFRKEDVERLLPEVTITAQ